MFRIGYANILLVVLTVLISLYYWIRQIKEVARKGLKFEIPTPFFGNNLKAALNLTHFNNVVNEIYYKFPNER